MTEGPVAVLKVAVTVNYCRGPVSAPNRAFGVGWVARCFRRFAGY